MRMQAIFAAQVSTHERTRGLLSLYSWKMLETAFLAWHSVRHGQ